MEGFVMAEEGVQKHRGDIISINSSKVPLSPK